MTIRRVLFTLPLVFVGWIVVMTGVMLVSDAAPAAVVIFPARNFVADLPDGSAILSASAISLTVTNDMSGFGQALYRAGAMLVLPAGLTGCLPLPKG